MLPAVPADTAAGQSCLPWVAQWATDLDGDWGLDWQAELLALQGEALGWAPLPDGVYVHVNAAPCPLEVRVVGLPDPGLQDMWAVLLVG